MAEQASASVHSIPSEGEAVRPGAVEFAKRAVDLVVSLVVLVACLPLFTLIAVAIKLDSRGPVFFCQERVGRDGARFRMHKFRSMRSDAERVRERLRANPGHNGPVLKIQNDPRITRVGKWLRRTSLDELPQFINVLVGQMSLVGPRPLPVRDVTGWKWLPDGVSAEAVQNWLAARHTVRPGITGLWQINGRSRLPLRDWVRYDLQYVRERSLLLDLKILIVTPFVAFLGQGAA